MLNFTANSLLMIAVFKNNVDLNLQFKKPTFYLLLKIKNYKTLSLCLKIIT